MRSTTGVNVATRRVSSAWRPFAGRLAEVLAHLQEDQYLIVSAKGSNRFVQFASQGAFGMRTETVCNAYLSASAHLEPAQVAALHLLGWRAPTGSPKGATPDLDPDGSPNYFVDLPAPVHFTGLAELATRTLVEALRVSHPGSLEYRSFDSLHNTLLWPDLGLKRASENDVAANIPKWLLATVREATSIHDLDFDADGDIAIRYGSALVWLRVAAERPHVRIVSALLQGVEESGALLSRLNELNASVGHTLFFAGDDCVFAAMHVPAAPYIADHVAQALREFCRLTDGLDEQLQSEFGGRTAFEEAMPSVLRH